MKLESYIKALQFILEKHGDIDVVESIMEECSGIGYYDFMANPKVEYIDGEWLDNDTGEVVDCEKVVLLASHLR